MFDLFDLVYLLGTVTVMYRNASFLLLAKIAKFPFRFAEYQCTGKALRDQISNKGFIY
jgi:hypothetical protein